MSVVIAVFVDLNNPCVISISNIVNITYRGLNIPQCKSKICDGSSSLIFMLQNYSTLPWNNNFKVFSRCSSLTSAHPTSGYSPLV